MIGRETYEAAILSWLPTRPEGRAPASAIATHLAISKSYAGVLLRGMRDAGQVVREKKHSERSTAVWRLATEDDLAEGA